ncbi:MAG: BrnA antitoxin family protein [Bryobacteraceae bacterium]
MAKASRLAHVPDGVPDAENPEWTADEARVAKSGAEVLPPAFLANLKRHRGPQKAPTKQMVSLRMDLAVLDAYRATGKGWQSRMHETLAVHAPLRRRRATAKRRTRKRSRA